MENSNADLSSKDLLQRRRQFRSLAHLGMLANLVVLIICFISGRHQLLEIYCWILLIFTLLGYFLARIHPSVAVHMMLSSYLVVFTLAGNSDLVNLPLLLVYPIIVGLAFLLFAGRANKMIYVAGTGIGLLLNIYFQLKASPEVGALLMCSSIAIGLFLLLTFSLLSYTQDKSLKNSMKNIYEKEQALLSQNEELTRYIESNIKLERFAHIAAHDLRSPLRTLSGFTALLNRSVQQDLDDQEKEYMSIIEDTIKTMAAQVEDLLEFSEANTHDLKLSLINLKDLIEEVINGINPDHQNAGWIDLVDLNKVLVGDSLKLRRVFQNIISNALKFTRVEVSPHIRISYADNNAYHCIEIADNGIGVPSEYHEQIFELYTRLEPDDFDGTGMGLSIARKIIERHEGEILVRNNNPSGAVFTISIAKKLGRVS